MELDSDEFERLFLGLWNISGYVFTKSSLQPLFSASGVPRFPSVGVLSLGILLDLPKCYGEPTRDNHSDTIFSQ